MSADFVSGVLWTVAACVLGALLAHAEHRGWVRVDRQR